MLFVEKSPMAFLDRVLDPPSYGFVRSGELYVPSRTEILGEFFRRLNIFRCQKNWLPLFSWSVILLLAPFLFLFFFRYFSWKLCVIGFIYSMVILGTHGTVYLHRYGSHNAFTFRNRFWLYLTRNLVIKTVPEEAYVVSHHVHHYLSEKPGDPYNVHGGWLYCFRADLNQQHIARDLSEADYTRTTHLIGHMGVPLNTYAQYRKWGSISHPLSTLLDFAFNWALWGSIFFFLGGLPLVCALFGWTGVWAVGIRTFNYDGHGGGRDKRQEGIDFNQRDLSINQLWPGMVTGEWHNNHHLYPNGVRAGFLPYQWDYAWLVIRSIQFLGGITQCRDFKDRFLADHYRPYLVHKKTLQAHSE